MQRFRAGLTGLGIVFLVTLVASFTWPQGEPEQASPPSRAPSEPLAQLGVAPSIEGKAGADARGAPPRAQAEPAPGPDPVAARAGNPSARVPTTA